MVEKLSKIAAAKEEQKSQFKLTKKEILKSNDFLCLSKLKPEFIFYKEYFKLLLYKRPGTQNSRIGAIIPKRNIRSSVERHLCYRIIKEAFRLNKIFLKQYDVLFIMNKSIKKISRLKLWHYIEDCLKNLQK